MIDTEPGLPGHFEKHLGSIDSGWRAPGFTIARYSQQIFGGIPYTTLGLSRHRLTMGGSTANIVRLELFMILPGYVKKGAVAELLEWFGVNAIKHHSAPLAGDVITIPDKLMRGTNKRALYVTIPVYMPDSFAAYADDDGDVVVAWLVPIAATEADYIAEQGWSSFEAMLAAKDPDLVDVRRPPVV